MACFISKSFFINDLNLTIVVYFFKNKKSGQIWYKKVKQTIT